MSTLTISPRAPGPEALLSVYHGGALLRYVGHLAPELECFLSSLCDCDAARFQEVFASLAPPGSDHTHWLRHGAPVHGVLGSLCLSALETVEGRRLLCDVAGVVRLPDLSGVGESTRRVCLLGAQYEKYRDPMYRSLLLSALPAYLLATDPPEMEWPANELLTTVRSSLWREDATARARTPAWLCLAPESGSLAHADLDGWTSDRRPSVMRRHGSCLVVYDDCAALGISADVAAQPDPDVNELVSRFCGSVGLDPLTWVGSVCEDLLEEDCSRGCVLVRLGTDEGDVSPFSDLNLRHGEVLFVVRA
jgi:hypothetical protein